jgi:hypothetical protein
MKKVLLVLAAIGALMLASTPSMHVEAAGAKTKTLWEGWLADMKAVRESLAKKK